MDQPSKSNAPEPASPDASATTSDSGQATSSSPAVRAGPRNYADDCYAMDMVRLGRVAIPRERLAFLFGILIHQVLASRNEENIGEPIDVVEEARDAEEADDIVAPVDDEVLEPTEGAVEAEDTVEPTGVDGDGPEDAVEQEADENPEDVRRRGVKRKLAEDETHKSYQKPPKRFRVMRQVRFSRRVGTQWSRRMLARNGRRPYIMLGAPSFSSVEVLKRSTPRIPPSRISRDEIDRLAAAVEDVDDLPVMENPPQRKGCSDTCGQTCTPECSCKALGVECCSRAGCPCRVDTCSNWKYGPMTEDEYLARRMESVKLANEKTSDWTAKDDSTITSEGSVADEEKAGRSDSEVGDEVVEGEEEGDVPNEADQSMVMNEVEEGEVVEDEEDPDKSFYGSIDTPKTVDEADEGMMADAGEEVMEEEDEVEDADKSIFGSIGTPTNGDEVDENMVEEEGNGSPEESPVASPPSPHLGSPPFPFPDIEDSPPPNLAYSDVTMRLSDGEVDEEEQDDDIADPQPPPAASPDPSDSSDDDSSSSSDSDSDSDDDPMYDPGFDLSPDQFSAWLLRYLPIAVDQNEIDTCNVNEELGGDAFFVGLLRVATEASRNGVRVAVLHPTVSVEAARLARLDLEEKERMRQRRVRGAAPLLELRQQLLKDHVVYGSRWTDLIIPIHVNGNHWTVAVVRRSLASATIYDSLDQPLSKELSILAVKKILAAVGKLDADDKATSRYPVRYCRPACRDIQDDGLSCGLYAINHARRALRRQTCSAAKRTGDIAINVFEERMMIKQELIGLMAVFGRMGDLGLAWQHRVGERQLSCRPQKTLITLNYPKQQ